MPVHPEETTDSDDPQQIIDKFYEELAVSDQDLIRMDKGGFRNWMDAMTDGIACLAEQSLQANAPTDQELPKSSPARKSLDMVRIDRERHIEEWRKSWRTEDIQALMVQNLFLRPWYKPKFEYLAQLFKGLEWLLVSAGTRGAVIQRADEISSSLNRFRSFRRTSRSTLLKTTSAASFAKGWSSATRS